MLKLEASVPEVKSLAQKEPERYRAGAGGWVTVKQAGRLPAKAVLKRWIAESYALMG